MSTLSLTTPSREMLIILTITVATATYIVFGFYFLRQIKIRRIRRREKFFEALTKSFQLGSIESIDDVINLLKGITTSFSEEEYKAGLTRWLRQYIVYLVTSESDKNFVNTCKQKISEFIRQNETTSPFSELPDNERNILKDIMEYLNTDNKDAIKRKLNELKISIQTRYDDLRQVKAQNKWSVPLAIIGLILTIIFGIISLFKSLLF